MSKSLLLLLLLLFVCLFVCFFVFLFFFTQELTIPYLDPAFPYFLFIAETQKRKTERYKEWKEGVME